MNRNPKHVGLDVYVFDLFSDTTCASLLEDIAAVPESAPNGMNKYGKPLFAAGKAWRDELTEIVDVFVQPLSVEKYGIRLKRQPYGFAVDYSPTTQKGLAKHFDSSDVTFNVCLGRKFTGGDLVCYDGAKKITIKQKPGRAILHLGSLTHRALPLISGSRQNLILWCRADKRYKLPDGFEAFDEKRLP
jgi:hypothetical protein